MHRLRLSTNPMGQTKSKFKRVCPPTDLFGRNSHIVAASDCIRPVWLGCSLKIPPTAEAVSKLESDANEPAGMEKPNTPQTKLKTDSFFSISSYTPQKKATKTTPPHLPGRVFSHTSSSPL